MNIGSIAPDRRVTVIAGLFVAGVLAVLAVWLVVKVGQPGLRVAYHAVFADVTGLRTGTPVQIAGYPVGVIRAIRPLHGGPGVRFRVDLAIDRDWPVPRDSSLTPATESLVSAPVLELRLGKAGETIGAGGEIPTLPPPPALAAVARAALDEDLRPALQTLRGTAEEVNRLMAENLPPMLADTRQVLAQVAVALPGVLRDVEHLTGGLGRTGEMMGAVSGPETRQRIEETIADLRSTAAELQRLTRGANALLRDNRGALGEGVQDAAFSLQALSSSIGLILANLERTAQDLAALVAELRVQPSAIFRGRPEEAPGGFRPR